MDELFGSMMGLGQLREGRVLSLVFNLSTQSIHTMLSLSDLSSHI